ncbi:MAG: MFS transporter [Gammaproteobacteria bacterium]|nr:MFS transporter [Gammaproteobacteria bacterium]MDX5374820.1 MFS transporter [Gammaproteobacteria bacterium]
MGLATGIAGAATLGVGVALTLLRDADLGPALIAGLILLAALLWVPAIAAYILIREQPGATEGGGNALAEALRSLSLLKTDAEFRHFVIARTLLLSVALAPPFYVLLAQQHTGGLADLGMLVIAGGIAGSLSAPVWGRMGDRSSRRVMALASFLAGLLGVTTAALAWLDSPLLDHGLVHAAIFLLLTVAHSGVRLGRKVYLVDMATQETRAAMVAVSNTVIGVAMLAAGLIGVLGDVMGTAAVILALAAASFVATVYAMNLVEVSG